MKKIFTLAALLVVALSVSAQGYRKWDFTSWSAQTVANLQAEDAAGGVSGGKWSSTEKATGDNPQPDNCYWSYASNISDEGYLMANGNVIAETEGLVWNTTYTAKRSLAIAVNYPSTSLGDYAGPQYLWLGGGNAKSAGARIYCFTIPKVHVGQKITIVAESHKPSDARGVALYAGACTDDANLIGEAFKPTTQASYTWEEGWTLPEGATPNDDGTVDIQVYNTNGCHLYSIEVGNPDQKSQVAYLYTGNLEQDLNYAALTQNDKFTTVPIIATDATKLSDLEGYDAIVISDLQDNAVATLKDIRPFIPTVILNANLYDKWGMGTAVTTTEQFADVKMPGHALFRNIELIEEDGFTGLFITNGAGYSAVTLNEAYANDPILATVMGDETKVAIHAHSLSRNAFIYMPALNEGADPQLLLNAVNVVSGSKAKVSQAPKPSIVLEYKNMNTDVSLKSTVAGASIFYTTDGSEPTEKSTLYTEPFNIDREGVTVKAVAIAEGYLLSEVAEQAVDLKKQAEAPTIEVASEEGKSIVTLTSGIEGASIYYNYDGNKNANQSTLYSEPIVLTYSRTIYAFVEAEGLVTSETASREVLVQGEKVRIDILAHMDANSAEYNGGSTSTAYYFSWGKNKSGDNAYSYFNPESRTEDTTTDPETGDEVITVTYTDLNPEEAKDFENGWMLRSRGQIVDWENLSTGNNLGDTSGYNYASADDVNPDFPATKGAIVLADKNTVPSDGQNFPYNAYIVTTQKYTGPFDIVINVASITKPDAAAKHQFVLETSTDGNVWESNWQTVGDTIYIEESARQTHNITRSYEGTDEVYVRAYLCGYNSKIGFYDIYLANQGEKSQERISGISDAQQTRQHTFSAIYGLNGTRHSSLRRGFNIVRYSDGTTRKIMLK